MNRKDTVLSSQHIYIRTRDHRRQTGTLKAALAPGPAFFSEMVEGHPECTQHVKRQSPSLISSAGFYKAFLTKKQLQGMDKQCPLRAPSGRK